MEKANIESCESGKSGIFVLVKKILKITGIVFACIIACIIVLTIILNLVTGTELSTDDKPFADSEYYIMGDYALHYRFQPAQGEAVGRMVFIHGFAMTTTAWENMSAIMRANGYDCLLVDLPGFGYSTRETLSVEHIPREDIVASLMEHLAPNEQWIVVGHSMGAGVSLVLTTKHTEQVSAVLLYAPGGDHIPESMTSVPEPLLYPLGLLANAGLGVAVPMLSSPSRADSINESLGDNMVELMIEPLRPKNTGMSMILTMFHRSSRKDSVAISELKMPILYCLGGDDPLEAPDSEFVAQTENALPPQTVRHIFDGLNHNMTIYDAEEICDFTLTFLANNGLR
jgi:pimeloyl-ACP methyl ester carboxylesterase